MECTTAVADAAEVAIGAVPHAGRLVATAVVAVAAAAIVVATRLHPRAKPRPQTG